MFFGIQVKKQSIAKIAAQKKLGGLIEETLTAVKLIASFAQEDKEMNKFEKLADDTRQVAQKTEICVAGFIGAFRFAIFGFYCYSFWVGTYFIQYGKINPCTNKTYTTGDILSVLVSVMTGMMMLFTIAPNMAAIVKAKIVGK